jgi:hypothetical protein
MEKGIALFERCEDPQGGISLTRAFLGTTLLARGDLGGAERMFEEGLASARRRGDPLCSYVALYNLAQLALARENLALAARTLEEGIQLSGHTKDRANLAYFLEALAAVEAFRGKVEHSALLLGAAEGSLQEAGSPVYNFYQPDPSLRERAVAEVRAALGEAGLEEAWARGQEMDFERAVAYALSNVGAPQSPRT